MTDDDQLDRLRAEVRDLRRQLDARSPAPRARRAPLIAALALLLLGLGTAIHFARSDVTAIGRLATLPDLIPDHAASGFVEVFFTRY